MFIRNMYAQPKSCIKFDGCNLAFFKSGVGVHQVENLLPILFPCF